MERNLRKQREGIVTSNKMDKTITAEDNAIASIVFFESIIF